jgi:NitT/TauT family transport system permease protein
VPRGRRLVDQIWPRVALVAAVLVVWSIVVATDVFSAHELPSPLDVWRALTSNLTGSNGLLEAAWGSLLRLAIGLGFSIVVGTVVGVGMAASRIVQRSVGTLMTGLQAIPPIAWLPVAILWLGFSERAVIFVVVIGAVPAIAIATAATVRQVPPALVRAGRTMGARGWALYRSVVLPAAVPGYWIGLQQAWAVAWRAVIAAELIRTGAARGLGHVLDASLQRDGSSVSVVNPALVFAALVVIVVIGLAVDYLFAVVDRRIRRRRGLLAPA